MARFKDVNWNLTQTTAGNIETWQQAEIAVLMDLRDELKESNRLQREACDGINSVRHFFHALGQERLKLLVREEHRIVALRVQRRRRRLAAARKKARS